MKSHFLELVQPFVSSQLWACLGAGISFGSLPNVLDNGIDGCLALQTEKCY